MPDPDAVLRRLTDRLAPLERELQRAFWAASTHASSETSAARQRAEEAWPQALADPGVFAEVSGPASVEAAQNARCRSRSRGARRSVRRRRTASGSGMPLL